MGESEQVWLPDCGQGGACIPLSTGGSRSSGPCVPVGRGDSKGLRARTQNITVPPTEEPANTWGFLFLF